MYTLHEMNPASILRFFSYNDFSMKRSQNYTPERYGVHSALPSPALEAKGFRRRST